MREEGRVGFATLAARRTALWAFLVLTVLAGSLGARASVSQEPLVAPTIMDCYFFPDPRVETSLFCGEDSTFQPAFLNSTVRFAVNVTDPEGENMNVTFYFDYWRPNPTGGQPIVNPDSPVANVSVVSPGPNETVLAEANWNYTVLSNFTNHAYWVYIEVRDVNGNLDSLPQPFSVVVNENSEPYVSGLLSVNSVSPPITYREKEVPPLLVDVSVGDLDGDPLTATWEWGDGTFTVNSILGSFDNTPVNVAHVYPVSLFPLNETPRVVNLTFVLRVDDGLGHNISLSAVAQYDIEFDRLPSVQVASPVVGSVWKVGEPVPIEGTATDLEGDSMVYFIDSDSSREPATVPCMPAVNCDGIRDNDRDFIGNKTSRAYDAAGNYSVTLWATDGVDKKFCLDPADCEPSLSHWRNQTIPFQVRDNQKPFVALSNQTAFADNPVVLRVAVFDPEGDSLTVTWDFGDGTVNATNVTVSSRGAPQTVELFQSHVYANVGRHFLTVEVTDGNETVSARRQVVVESFDERPDIIRIDVLRSNLTAAGNNTFAINETVVLRITIHDFEGDDLEIRVDWADGNVTVVNVNVTGGPNCTVDELNRTLCSFTVSHAYGEIGNDALREYRINVTVTDHNEFLQWNYTENRVERIQSHETSQPVLIYISDPKPVVPDVWDVWDFSTFAAVLGIPVFLTARWAFRVRKERKEE